MFEERSILLVEDSDDDVILIQRALRKGGITAPIHIARDGEEALAYFEGTGKFFRAPRLPLPTLVLLDLKLPRKNGLEVLQWVRGHRTLATLPIVVFTTSTEPSDLERAYALGANSYLKKPVTLNETTELLKTVGIYWLAYNEQPPFIRRGV